MKSPGSRSSIARGPTQTNPNLCCARPHVYPESLYGGYYCVNCRTYSQTYTGHTYSHAPESEFWGSGVVRGRPKTSTTPRRARRIVEW
jgi:hypothetical protein